MERGKGIQLFAVLTALVLFVLVTAEDTKVCCYNGDTGQNELLDTADGKVDANCNPADGGLAIYTLRGLDECPGGGDAQPEATTSPTASPETTPSPTTAPEATPSPTPSPEPTPEPYSKPPAETMTTLNITGQELWGTSLEIEYTDGNMFCGNRRYRYHEGRWQVKGDGYDNWSTIDDDLDISKRATCGVDNKLPQGLINNTFENGMDVLWDSMRGDQGFFSKDSLKVHNGTEVTQYKGDGDKAAYTNLTYGQLTENPCLFADVKLQVSGEPAAGSDRRYHVEFCVVQKEGTENRTDSSPGYDRAACIDYIEKHGLRDREGKKIGIEAESDAGRLTFTYEEPGQMFYTSRLGRDIYGEGGYVNVIESLDPSVKGFVPDVRLSYSAPDAPPEGADQTATTVPVSEEWKPVQADEVGSSAAENAADSAVEDAAAKAMDAVLQPLDFGALKCPERTSYDNKADFGDEYIKLVEDLSGFYTRLIGYVEVFRSAVADQQAACHADIKDFVEAYANGCGMKELTDKDNATIESAIVDDSFDPSVCGKAVADRCLVDRGWACNIDPVANDTRNVTEIMSCPMCTIEPCCLGLNCTTCGNYRFGLPPCMAGGTPEQGVLCEETYVCCKKSYIEDLEEKTYVRAWECQRTASDCMADLPQDQSPYPAIEDICRDDFLLTSADCRCTQALVYREEADRGYYEIIPDTMNCNVKKFDMPWIELDREGRELPGKSSPVKEWTEEMNTTLATEPFGVAGCKNNERLDLGYYARGLIRTVKGYNAVAKPLELEDCQREAADLKDVCTLDGAGIFIGDDKEHGPTEVLKKLDSLIAIMEMYVANMKRSATLAKEIKGQDAETLVDADSSSLDSGTLAEFEKAITDGMEKVNDTQEDLKNLVNFVKGNFTHDVTTTDFFENVTSFIVQSSKNWEYEKKCSPHLRPRFDKETCEPLNDTEFELGHLAGQLVEMVTGFKIDGSVDCNVTERRPMPTCGKKKRGGCNATESLITVSDTNPDAWTDTRLLDLMKNIDPEKLFINDADCFNYDTEEGGGMVVDDGDSGEIGDVPPPIDGGSTPWYGPITPGEDIPETEKDPFVQCCQRIFGIEDSSWAGGGIVDTARSWLGVPYVFGGTSRSGVDCSGLTMNVLRENGINVPRTASQQYHSCQSNGGTYVDWGDLQAGDIVFFENTYKPGVSHVGVYAGDDRMIHAPKPGDVVKIVQLSNSYFREHWTGGCRYVEGGASYEALDIDWCEDDTDGLCCQGPGLELEKKITEEECGLTCEELCEGKYERHSFKYLLCRHKCGARDEQCVGKPEESLCEVDGMKGLCCEERCMVHALMCAGRVEVCVGLMSLDACSFDGERGVCCGGRCLTGETDCSSCKDMSVYAQNPDTGACDKFTNTCDVPDGWVDCESFGCDTDEDETYECSKEGELGVCCGYTCALNAEDCVPDDSCLGMGNGVPCYAKDVPGVCCGEKCAVGGTRCGECVQAITHAKDPITDACKEFSTPCDVPYGWTACEGYGCAGLIDGAACTKKDEIGICCGNGCVVDATACVVDPAVCDGKAEGEACVSDDKDGVCCDGNCALGGTICGGCAQVVSFALDPATQECKQFSTPCDVPKGWPPCIVESCLSECQNEYPENPSLARNCRELCETMDISCEERCIMDFSGRDERLACIERCPGVITPQMPESLRYCEEDCIDFNSGEPAPTLLCFRLCRAIHPRIHVTFALLRGGQEAESFFTGESPRMRVEVENRGSAGFAGDMDVALRILDACECEPCPDDYMCSCDCEEDERQVFSLDNIMLAPGEKARYLTDPVTLQSELAGTTVQPVATVRDTYDQVIGKPLGSFYGISEAEKLAVNDASFMVNDRERATAAYPGEDAVGYVVFSTDQVPVTLDLFMVGWDGKPIEGTGMSHTVTWPTRMETFTTSELEVDTAHVDFVIRLGYKVTDASGAVLAEGTLDEQGRPPGLCTGRDLTTWCEGLHERVKLSYPDAYLEVKRPMLDVADAAFVDNDGLAVNRLSGSDSVRANLELTNLAAQGFEGTVIVKVVGTDGMAVPESVVALDIDRGLEGAGSSIDVESGFVWPKPGASFRIWVQATDRDGRIWLDQIVPAALFPFAELTVTQDTTEGLVRNTIFTTIIHEGCQASIRCDDCLTTCELRVDRARCTVTRERCDCECIMGAI